MAPLTRHRFTTEEFEKMAAAGVFGDDQRVELIEGEVVEMTPIGDVHGACVDRLTRWLVLGVGERGQVRIRGAVRIGRYSEPQPDVLVLAPRGDDYQSGNPREVDVLLLIEVADSSLDKDRNYKRPVYERERVREIWIVGVNGEAVEVEVLQPDGSWKTALYRRGDTVSPSAFPDVVIDVDCLLGKAV